MSLDSTYVDVQNVLETRFRDNFVHTDSKIFYENVGDAEPFPPYVKFFIRNGRSAQIGQTGKSLLMRRPGLVIAQCFTRTKKGVKEGRLMAQKSIDIFEYVSLGDIDCAEGELTEIGVDKKTPNLYQVNGVVRFTFDYERALT